MKLDVENEHFAVLIDSLDTHQMVPRGLLLAIRDRPWLGLSLVYCRAWSSAPSCTYSRQLTVLPYLSNTSLLATFMLTMSKSLFKAHSLSRSPLYDSLTLSHMISTLGWQPIYLALNPLRLNLSDLALNSIYLHLISQFWRHGTMISYFHPVSMTLASPSIVPYRFISFPHTLRASISIT